MHTVATDSLLDEADFLGELETLKEGKLPTPMRARPPGKFVEPEEPVAQAAREVDHDVSPLVGLAAAATFMLMMAVGAAGAALVFHDRVARILAMW